MVKQVIVIRKDLKMRRGKEISQGSHASMAFLLDEMKADGTLDLKDFSAATRAWIDGLFTKVCLQVGSEAELIAVFHAAYNAGLDVHLITDAGATEFHGVPTMTCLAIGPDEAEKIDPITKHLSLY